MKPMSRWLWEITKIWRIEPVPARRAVRTARMPGPNRPEAMRNTERQRELAPRALAGCEKLPTPGRSAPRPGHVELVASLARGHGLRTNTARRTGSADSIRKPVEGVECVEKLRPNEAGPARLAPGFRNCGVLNMFNISARNCTVWPSRTRKFLNSEKSQFRAAGPRRIFRARIAESAGFGHWVKAAMLNWLLGMSLLAGVNGSPGTRSGRVPKLPIPAESQPQDGSRASRHAGP